MNSRIVQLEKVIKKANLAYYTSDNPTMSDAEYDAFRDELKTLDPTNALLATVGSSVEHTPLQKVKHTIPMGSLDKVKTEEEFLQWVKKTGSTLFVSQEKLDGLSVELVYHGGILECASSRGDGLIGEDITHNVQCMQNVRTKLPRRFTGSLRGEIILETEAFEKHFSGKANPRNAAAGAARAFNTDLAQYLKVLYFDCLSEHLDFTTEGEKLLYVSDSLKLEVGPYSVHRAEDIIEVYNSYVAKTRNSLHYEIDGLVAKVDNLEYQNALGVTSDRPNGQIAWKFPPATAKTRVLNISWDMGLTGRLTPCADLEPVKCGGVTISRCTLHNYKRIKDYGIVKDALVLISRRNDVIPSLEEVISRSGESLDLPEAPKACPVCQGETRFEGEHLMCANPECSGKVYGDFAKYTKIIGVDECGEAFLETVIEQGLVKDVADLYSLKVEDLADLPGYGEQSASVILSNLKAKSTMRMPVFFASLNIAGASKATFEAIEKAGMASVEAVLSANAEKLGNVEGIGQKTAMSIVVGLDRKRETIAKLLKYVKIEQKKQGKLTGMSFCFTGEICIRRELAQQLVLDNGGEVKSSVSKGLTYLVQADPSSTSGKSQKALKYGTKIMGEAEFLELVEFDLIKNSLVFL